MHRDLGERYDPAFAVTGVHAGLLYQALSFEVRLRCTALEYHVDLVVERAGAGLFEFDCNILDIVFHSQSRLVITELAAQQTAAQKKAPPRTLEKKVRDIVSGAMLESIVSRAKRIAVKREIEDRSIGIIWADDSFFE